MGVPQAGVALPLAAAAVALVLSLALLGAALAAALHLSVPPAEGLPRLHVVLGCTVRLALGAVAPPLQQRALRVLGGQLAESLPALIAEVGGVGRAASGPRLCS